MSMENMQGETFDQKRSVRTTLQVCYTLYSLSLILGGLPTVSFFIFSGHRLYFLFGIVAAVVATIIAYTQGGDAEDYPTLKEHFAWQINTFWGLLALGIVGCLPWWWDALSTASIIPSVAGWCWGLYRVIKGWLYLSSNKSLYGDTAPRMAQQSSSAQARSDDRPGQAAPGPRFCVKCGNPLEPNSSFCSNCGNKI